MTRVTALALFLLVAPAFQAAAAQAASATADIARARAPLAPLAWMVGQWEGEATGTEGPGRTFTVRQHEDVVFGANETVLIIRGTGRNPGSGDVVFAAAAVLWTDENGQLAMRTHRDGRSLRADVTMRGDTLVWGFPVPGGRVAYSIWRGPNGTWEEIGEFLREGQPPVRTITMSLRRLR